MHYADLRRWLAAPRFFLLITQQLANTNLAEIVVMTKDNVARERVTQRMLRGLRAEFPEFRGRVNAARCRAHRSNIR